MRCQHVDKTEVAAGVPGPPVSSEFLRRIASHVDNTGRGEAFCRTTTIGVSNGTAFNIYLPAVVLPSTNGFVSFGFRAFLWRVQCLLF